MFDIKSIPMTVEKNGNVTKITVHPADLYPVIIARIRDVLVGANPNELLASTERGGSARADRLVAEARNLPEQAWLDAVCHRNEYGSADYFSFVERNGRLKESMMELLPDKARGEVLRMVQRGYALEIAMGWFLHAIRLEFGACDTTITPADETEKQFFRL